MCGTLLCVVALLHQAELVLLHSLLIAVIFKVQSCNCRCCSEYLDAEDDLSCFGCILEQMSQQYREMMPQPASNIGPQPAAAAAATPATLLGPAAAAVPAAAAASPLLQQQAAVLLESPAKLPVISGGLGDAAAAAAAPEQLVQASEPASSIVAVLLPPLPGDAAAAAAGAAATPQAVLPLPPTAAAATSISTAAGSIKEASLASWLGASQLYAVPTASAAPAAFGTPCRLLLPASAPAAAAVPGLQMSQLQQQQFMSPHTTLKNPHQYHYQQQQQHPGAVPLYDPGTFPATPTAAAPPITAPSTAAAAGGGTGHTGLPSILRPFLQYSRRPQFLTGAEPQHGHTAAAADGTTAVGLAAVPGAECRLCYREIDTLVGAGVFCEEALGVQAVFTWWIKCRDVVFAGCMHVG
jgi:hypothetical protein